MKDREKARKGNTYRGKPCVHGHGTLRYEKTKTCVVCNKNRCRARNKTVNREGHNEYMRRRRNEKPGIYMLSAARTRSKKFKVPFDLFADEIIIPDKCPVLGIPLVFGTGLGKHTDNSPSLDRVVPEKGYVRGNVRVVSFRANALRSNATVEELEAVLRDAYSLRNNGMCSDSIIAATSEAILTPDSAEPD